MSRSLLETAWLVPAVVGLLTALLWWALIALRTRAERERASTNRLATTLESIADGCFSVDALWRFSYVNGAFERLCAIRREDVLGRRFQEVFPPAEAPHLHAELRRCTAHQVAVELEFFHEAWGRWFFVRAFPTPDGGFVQYLRDRTERKWLEDQQRRQTALIESINNNTTDLIYMKDRTGRMTYCNAATLSAMGLSAEAALTRGPFVRFANEAEVEPIAANDRMVFESGRPLVAEEVYTTADGQRRVYLSTKSPLRGADGEVVGVVGVSHDITETTRHAQLHREQRAVLEMIAGGRPLAECLEAITEAVHRLSPEVRACVLVATADRATVGEVYATHFPSTLAAGFRGAAIGTVPIGTCGAAMHSGHTVTCDDIARSTYWAPEWTSVCLAHGIRACCSQPIMGSDRQAIASFLLCLSVPREPDPWERRLAEFGAHVAGIALERERAARALLTSEARYRTLFDSIDEGFCVVEVEFDPGGHPVDYRILEMNPAFERHTGLHVAPGASVRQSVPDMEEFWFETYGRVAATQEPVRFEHPSEALGRRWFDVYAFPLGDAARRKVAILFTDISARKGAEQALRASEANAALALGVARLGTWTWHVDAHEVEADARCRQVCGFPAEGRIGIEELRHRVHADDWPRIRQALRGALATERDGFYGEEFRMVHADGSLHWVVSRGRTLVEDTAGEQRVVRMLGTVLDITDRKVAEQRLQDADRRKDEFLATLAHELRNPLAPIRNGLQILRMTGDHEATRARVVDMMERQLNHMVRLVDDLLEVSRITRGKIEFRAELVELHTIVRSAVETATPMIDAARHTLQVTLPEEPLVLHADPVRLAQVIGNLLNNAAKYTEDGGQLWLTARRDDDQLVLSVRDTGTGIPPEQLGRVFELFTQVDGTPTRAQGGLGIGLALVRSLVQMHGGCVEAHSEGLGRGSEFVVRLPLATPLEVEARDRRDIEPAVTEAARRQDEQAA
ncbi:MAG: PAS domain-containing protein [Gemmatimonadaceae bacterium]|nr:PAS domain-containing protein [Gemmatimonadaceae bacterium]